MATENASDNVVPLRHYVPRADSWLVFRCPVCPHAHVVLLDKEENPIAEFIVGSDNVARLTIEVFEACAGKGELLP